MSGQQIATKQSSIFSVGNFFAVALALVLMGGVFLLLRGNVSDSKAEEKSQLQRLVENQSLVNAKSNERIAALETELQALKAYGNNLTAAVGELRADTDVSIGVNFKKAISDSEVRAAELDAKLEGDITASQAKARADLLAVLESAKVKPASSTSANDLDGLKGQISSLEQSFDELRNQMVNDKSKLEIVEATAKNATDIQTLTDGMMSMNGLALDMVGNYAELHGDVDDLELAHKKLASRADEIETKALSSANRLLAVSRLRDALETNGAFNTDLENLRKYTEQGSALDQLIGDLEPISSEAIESTVSIQASFQQISNELLAEELAAQVAQGSKSDQLKAGFVSLLGVTRQDGSAVISTKESELETPLNQIKIAFDAGDLASAMTGIVALDTVPTDTFASVVNRLEKRMKIEDAQNKLDAWLVSLGSSSLGSASESK